MKSQALGLAQAIKALQPNQNTCKIVEKKADLNKWGKYFPGHLNPLPWQSLTKTSSSFDETTWPDILLTCGRRSSAISIAIGKASGGKTYRAHIQNPQTPTKYFDFIASMQHDALTGSNVINTKVALHKLTAKTLQKEHDKWQNTWQEKRLFSDNSPILGVCLGGKNKKYGFDKASLDNLISTLKNARTKNNATILLTPSSRTEEFVKSALKSHFAADNKVWIWDQTGDNPYFGVLSNAQHLLVTADSVSMISEALFTNSPVHTLPLSGTSRRHKIFLDILVSEKLIHPIDKLIDFSVQATNQPIDETNKIAQMINQSYIQHCDKG